MKSILITLWAENLKVRKSKIFWLSFVFFVFVSIMMGLIVFVQQHPELAEKMGMIGTKASLLKFGEPNWKNYFTLLAQGIAGIGIVGFGFITTWVFGREFTDHTMKDIIALPVSRTFIVVSKIIVTIIWSVLLALTFFISGLFFGFMAGITGWSGEIFSQFVSTFTKISLLTILLCTPVAFFASYGRGFLLSIGIIILTMIMANFTGLVGLGPYFPWSIPGSLCVPPYQIKVISYLILSATSFIGLAGTMFWWQFADHK